MDTDEFKLLYSKIFKNLSLWASQSYKRSLIIILIFLILGVPLIGYLQSQVSSFHYISLATTALFFLQKTFNILYYLIIFGFFIVGILLYIMYRMLVKNWIIIDKFNGGLNGWAIPLESSWTTQKCIDNLGKMLSVTNANYPGTLKGAYWWYDYEVYFEAKIDKDSRNKNFSLVIRSESNFNGIMLQITKTHLQPHFLYNGTFIIDTDARQQLPTTLKPDEWIKVKIIVKGNDVDIYINDYKLQYKIPTKVFNVANEVMSRGTVTLEDIENSHNDIKGKITRINDIFAMQESAAKDAAIQTVDPILKTIPPYSRIILEYQKGSVGFREAGGEQAHFRDFKVKRI